MASATVALCVAAWVIGAAAAFASPTIPHAPTVSFGKALRGQLFDSTALSGAAVSFWTVSLVKGDHVFIKTRSTADATPPCQLIYPPGTTDQNISPTATLLEFASQTRDGSVDGQRWVADQTGSYVLAMTNDDIYLSGPHQCLDAPVGQPFTFTVSVAHHGSRAGAGRSSGSEVKAKRGARAARSAESSSTHVVQPGQSLWGIAQGLLGEPAGVARVASEVGRLWQLNAARIGTGNPDLIFPGQSLRLQ